MKRDRVLTMEEFKGLPKKPDLAAISECVSNLMEMSSIIKEKDKIMAGITRAKYQALVAEGFTQEQAIELCKGEP